MDHVELKHLVHIEVVETKRERLLTRVNATSTRTAEVTISIALDSYRIPSRYCIKPLISVFLSGRSAKKGSLTGNGTLSSN